MGQIQTIQKIDEIQQNFIDAFNEIGEWMMQYEFLLQIGAELEAYPPDQRNDAHLIPGCQSKVWITCEVRSDRIHIWGDSEALIIKGMIAVAIFMFQDQKLEDVHHAKVTYITDTDIKDQITTDRFRGLHSVIDFIQNYGNQLI